MKILDYEIDSIIFDLDGTLFDSMGMWLKIDEDFFNKRGLQMPFDYSKKIATLGLDKAAIYTKETFHLKDSLSEIKEEWYNDAKYHYENLILLKPHVVELLDFFKGKGIKMAIATANEECFYKPCLKRNQIDSYFTCVKNVKNYKEGKNSSQIFLDVIEDLKTRPENTLVFEDSLQALLTCKKAHFVTCAVHEKYQTTDEEEKKTFDFYIKDYSDFLKKIALSREDIDK